MLKITNRVNSNRFKSVLCCTKSVRLKTPVEVTRATEKSQLKNVKLDDSVLEHEIKLIENSYIKVDTSWNDKVIVVCENTDIFDNFRESLKKILEKNHIEPNNLECERDSPSNVIHIRINAEVTHDLHNELTSFIRSYMNTVTVKEKLGNAYIKVDKSWNKKVIVVCRNDYIFDCFTEGLKKILEKSQIDSNTLECERDLLSNVIHIRINAEVTDDLHNELTSFIRDYMNTITFEEISLEYRSTDFAHFAGIFLKKIANFDRKVFFYIQFIPDLDLNAKPYKLLCYGFEENVKLLKSETKKAWILDFEEEILNSLESLLAAFNGVFKVQRLKNILYGQHSFITFIFIISKIYHAIQNNLKVFYLKNVLNQSLLDRIKRCKSAIDFRLNERKCYLNYDTFILYSAEEVEKIDATVEFLMELVGIEHTLTIDSCVEAPDQLLQPIFSHRPLYKKFKRRLEMWEGHGFLIATIDGNILTYCVTSSDAKHNEIETEIRNYINVILEEFDVLSLVPTFQEPEFEIIRLDDVLFSNKIISEENRSHFKDTHTYHERAEFNEIFAEVINTFFLNGPLIVFQRDKTWNLEVCFEKRQVNPNMFYEIRSNTFVDKKNLDIVRKFPRWIEFKRLFEVNPQNKIEINQTDINFELETTGPLIDILYGFAYFMFLSSKIIEVVLIRRENALNIRNWLNNNDARLKQHFNPTYECEFNVDPRTNVFTIKSFDKKYIEDSIRFLKNDNCPVDFIYTLSEQKSSDVSEYFRKCNNYWKRAFHNIDVTSSDNRIWVSCRTYAEYERFVRFAENEIIHYHHEMNVGSIIDEFKRTHDLKSVVIDQDFPMTKFCGIKNDSVDEPLEMINRFNRFLKEKYPNVEPKKSVTFEYDEKLHLYLPILNKHRILVDIQNKLKNTFDFTQDQGGPLDLKFFVLKNDAQSFDKHFNKYFRSYFEKIKLKSELFETAKEKKFKYLNADEFYNSYLNKIHIALERNYLRSKAFITFNDKKELILNHLKIDHVLDEVDVMSSEENSDEIIEPTNSSIHNLAQNVKNTLKFFSQQCHETELNAYKNGHVLVKLLSMNSEYQEYKTKFESLTHKVYNENGEEEEKQNQIIVEVLDGHFDCLNVTFKGTFLETVFMSLYMEELFGLFAKCDVLRTVEPFEKIENYIINNERYIEKDCKESEFTFKLVHDGLATIFTLYALKPPDVFGRIVEEFRKKYTSNEREPHT